MLDGVREMMSAKAAAEEEMKLETVKRRKKYKEIQVTMLQVPITASARPVATVPSCEFVHALCQCQCHE